MFTIKWSIEARDPLNDAIEFASYDANNLANIQESCTRASSMRENFQGPTKFSSNKWTFQLTEMKSQSCRYKRRWEQKEYNVICQSCNKLENEKVWKF